MCWGFFPGTTTCFAGTTPCAASGAVTGGQASTSGSTLYTPSDAAVAALAGHDAAMCLGCAIDTDGPCQYPDGRCADVDERGSCPAPATLCASQSGALTEAVSASGSTLTAFVQSPSGRVEVSLHLSGMTETDLAVGSESRSALLEGLGALWGVSASDLSVVSVSAGRHEGGMMGSTGLHVRMAVYVGASGGSESRSASSVLAQVMGTAETGDLATVLHGMTGSWASVVGHAASVEGSGSASMVEAWSTATDSDTSGRDSSRPGNDSEQSSTGVEVSMIAVGGAMGFVALAVIAVVGGVVKRRRGTQNRSVQPGTISVVPRAFVPESAVIHVSPMANQWEGVNPLAQ